MTETDLNPMRTPLLLLSCSAMILLNIAGCPTTSPDPVDETPDPGAGQQVPPPGTSPDPVANTPPVAIAGADSSLAGPGAFVLDGRSSFDSDGSITSFLWQQEVTGSVEVTITNAALDNLEVQLPVQGTYTFKLTVTDNDGSTAEDLITITVGPPGVINSARWSNGTDNVFVELDWLLPSGDWLRDFTTTGWDTDGSSSVFQSQDVIEDGLHWFQLAFRGNARTASVNYLLDFFDYEFLVQDVLQGAFKELIVLDVIDGEPYILFNSWLTPDTSDSGGLTGAYTLEAQSGWRNAPDTVNVNQNILQPDGQRLTVNRWGWDNVGFERSTLPNTIALEDGLYRFFTNLEGNARIADVIFEMSAAGINFRQAETLRGPTSRQVAVDVINGVGRVIYNNWLDADNDWSPALPQRREIEVVGAWRDASDQVEINLRVTKEGTGRLPVNRDDWGLSGVSYFGYDGPSPLEDGTYLITFVMNGNARTATVAFRASVLNWSFDFEGDLLGPVDHTITIEVRNGRATELANTWP